MRASLLCRGIKDLVSVSHKEGVLEGEERDMIYNVFDFRILKSTT